jgi:LacI family transcriptional regulator
VLNGRATQLRISDETAQRVRRAAEELGYVPKASARTLRQGRSRVLGFLMDAIPESPYVPVMHSVLTAALRRTQERSHLLLATARPRNAVDGSYIDAMTSDAELAGVVAETSEANESAAERLRLLDLPVVWMSKQTPSRFPAGLANVYADESTGVIEALSRVVLHEGQQVLVLNGPGVRTEREQAARELFPGRLHSVEAQSWLPTDGYAAAQAALHAVPRVGLVFACSDLLAIGAIQACVERGLDVPRDVSVVGFGGFDPERPHGGLTTVRWPLRELATAAFDVLIDHLETWPRTDEVWHRPAPIAAHLPSGLIPGTTALLSS